GGSLEGKRKPELLQQRQDPGFASNGRSTFLAARQPSVEGVPMDQRFRECLLDFIAQPGIEAEVRRTLAQHVLGRRCDLLDKIAADKTAFDGDRETPHQECLLTGTSTKQPRMSGGVCG